MADVEGLKNEGNKHFTNQRYEDAADSYRKAINLIAANDDVNSSHVMFRLCSQESEALKFKHILYTNLCICNFNLQQYDEALQNAQSAISANIKWEKVQS
jgi:tetratricopeptide (TPR) repeat protein